MWVTGVRNGERETRRKKITQRRRGRRGSAEKNRRGIVNHRADGFSGVVMVWERVRLNPHPFKNQKGCGTQMPFELGRGQKSRRRMRWRARSNMNRAAARLAEMPREGKDDRRKVWRSMERSPAIR